MIGILLLVLLRLIAVPFILLIVWWSKKQQPDGPDQGKYMVEIGAPVHGSPCLWERVVPDVCGYCLFLRSLSSQKRGCFRS